MLDRLSCDKPAGLAFFPRAMARRKKVKGYEHEKILKWCHEVKDYFGPNFGPLLTLDPKSVSNDECTSLYKELAGNKLSYLSVKHVFVELFSFAKFRGDFQFVMFLPRSRTKTAVSNNTLRATTSRTWSADSGQPG